MWNFTSYYSRNDHFFILLFCKGQQVETFTKSKEFQKIIHEEKN